MSTNDWGKNDGFFLGRIKRGDYQVTGEGKIFSTRSRKWIGEGGKNKRYTTIEARDNDGRVYYTTKHRLVYLAAKGRIKRGHTVNHEDDNKKNNAPSNLVANTHSYNIQHSYRLGLQPRIPIGESHWLAKLSNADVRRIRNRYKAGDGSYRSLAREYGVSHSLVGAIICKQKRRTK